MWSKAQTEIQELDDEDGTDGRKALSKWLREKKVKVPKAADFDFQAWLDTPDGAAKAPPPPRSPSSAPQPR